MLKRKLKISEVSEYVINLQKITMLRDKCADKVEKELYNRNIESMQRVLLVLSKV